MIAAFGFISAICLSISIAPNLRLPLKIPDWSDIFSAVGLRNDSPVNKLPFSVHFIDVGQGECILIKSKNANLLVDAGERGNSETVIRYLRNNNISKLDYVIVTHPDLDHIGSMPDVIENIAVSNIIMPRIDEDYYPKNETFEMLLEEIRESSIKVYAANSGDDYLIGDVKMTVLGPVTQRYDSNDMSVVIRIVYGKTSFILTGDAEYEEENEIINSGETLEADVLKAGHHGSKNSSNAEFLKKVAPGIVIISCGEDNSYGHPNPETLDRFKTIHAKVYRTDKLGTIVVGSDGEVITNYFEN